MWASKIGRSAPADAATSRPAKTADATADFFMAPILAKIVPMRPRPIKNGQMLGADEFPTEAYAAYAAGRERGGNDADGRFSSAWAADAAGTIADALGVRDRGEDDAAALADALLVGAAMTADDPRARRADERRRAP